MADLWVMIPKAGFERMVEFGGWWRSVILVGVCWVKISEYANLFLGLIVGVLIFGFSIFVGIC